MHIGGDGEECTYRCDPTNNNRQCGSELRKGVGGAREFFKAACRSRGRFRSAGGVFQCSNISSDSKLRIDSRVSKIMSFCNSPSHSLAVEEGKYSFFGVLESRPCQKGSHAASK